MSRQERIEKLKKAIAEHDVQRLGFASLRRLQSQLKQLEAL